MSCESPRFPDWDSKKGQSNGNGRPEIDPRIAEVLSSQAIRELLSQEARENYGEALRTLGCHEEDVQRNVQMLQRGTLPARFLDVSYQSQRAAIRVGSRLNNGDGSGIDTSGSAEPSQQL